MRHPGKYMYAADNNVFYLKLVGECNYANCSGLDKLVAEAIKNGAEKTIIDLSETDWLDSTVLGHIASIVRLRPPTLESNIPVVITSNPEVLHLLKSLSFDKYFCILSDAPRISAKFKELHQEHHSPEEMAESILHAHQNLIELDENNREKFKDVIELLEHELQNHKKS